MLSGLNKMEMTETAAEKIEAAAQEMAPLIIEYDDRFKGEERCYRVLLANGAFLIDYHVPGWQAVFTLQEASAFICKIAYKAALKKVMEDYMKGDIKLGTF